MDNKCYRIAYVLFFCTIFSVQISSANEIILSVKADENYSDHLENAKGLIIDAQGKVYFTSSEDGSILTLDNKKIINQQQLTTIFDDTDLTGLAQMENGNFVVSNEGSDQLAILDPEFKKIRVFSQSGSGAGEVADPLAIAVSVNNNIYVVDNDNSRISVFNDQGLFLFSFGNNGFGFTDLNNPSQIALDAKENIYVLEKGESGRISIYDARGKLLKQIKTSDLSKQLGSSPDFTAMTADFNGLIYVADYNTAQVYTLDWQENKVIDKFGTRGQSQGQYIYISHLAVNNVGQLAVLDNDFGKVEVFQLEQKNYDKPVITNLLRFGDELKVGCQRTYAFIQNQSFCIKPESGKIVIISPDGKELGDFAAEIQQPKWMHTGNKYVAIIKDNKLYAYDHEGKQSLAIGRYGISPGGFDDPSYVFTRDDKFYVSDTGNNRVQVFSRDGQIEAVYDSNTKGVELFGSVGPIAVDSELNVYVADRDGSGQIRVISKDKELITNIGAHSDSIYKVSRFIAIDMDRQDRLYVLAGSEANDYGVIIYQDHQPILAFGAGDENGSDIYFTEATTLSISSTDKNSVYIHDEDAAKLFRFDYLEYPDAAFGLNIVADEKSMKLDWSSSKSPLIAEYEIQGSSSEDGDFSTISTSKDHSIELDASQTNNLTWFRIVSVSGYDLKATPSAAKENKFQKIALMYQAKRYDETIVEINKLLKVAEDNHDARNLLALSLFHTQAYRESIPVFKKLESQAKFKNDAIRYQVQAYFELEEYLDAKGLIDDVINQAPKDVQPYLICTELSIKLADAIGAVTCAEDGLSLHENHVRLRYLLGKSYILAGIEDQGLMEYQTVIDNNPENHEIRLQIADDLLALNQFDQALAYYDEVLQQQSSSGAAATGKAKALLALGMDDEAKTIAIGMSGKKETRGDGYYLLGKIALKQQKYTEAVLRFTRASRDKPEHVDNWVALAQSYIELNQLPKATRSLNQGIKKNPQAFELYQLAGSIELDLSRFPQASALLDKAVEINPNSLDAQKNYARSLFNTRNYRSAALHAEQAARISPKDIDVLTLQADVASQQGKAGSAIEFLKTALSIKSTSAELQYQLGRVYQDANLFDASREHLEKASNINPNWAVPVAALGNLFIKRRLFDDAIVSFEKAVSLDPSEQNRALLNTAFAEKKRSLEFKNNAPQLVLADLNLSNVFSAAYKKYSDEPIGTVKLKNAGATDYGNLKLSFQIKEYMDFPTTLDIPTIKGNETQEIPIKATFNNKILEVDEDTGVQVEIKVSYLRDGQKDDITLTQAMTIYGKNAIVWGDANMVGSFVTPKDDTLRDYVRQVVNKFQPDIGPLNDKLVTAMTYFSSLNAAGTKYLIDPNTPFTSLRDDQVDYVQFPRETLRLKSGDCDDLSVLISAGLENLGIQTAFVEVPGHLFMMFNTNLPAEDSDLISQDKSLIVLRDDQVWIPIEATMIASDFTEAWAEGANKYYQGVQTDKLGIIDVKNAWKKYKPVTLRKASYSIDLPDTQRTRNVVRQARTTLLGNSINRLIRPYQAMISNNPKNISARLQIAILYARFGLYSEAEQEFSALEELAPQNSAVQSNIGNLEFLQKNYQQAITKYNRAIDLDDQDGGLFLNRSMALYRSGEIEKAASSFQQATALSPKLQQQYQAYSKLLNQ